MNLRTLYRHVALLFALLGACASAGAQVTTHGAATRATESADSAIVDFLIVTAAKDFTLAGAPAPTHVRTARLGRLHKNDGTDIFFLCGSVMPAGKHGTANWLPFATIKTSDYEQWLGAQAKGFCEQPGIAWFNGDLAPRLEAQFKARP